MTNKNNNDELAYLFNVDILIKDTSNALALQSLITLLNQGNLVDYRIKSGVELGEIIEATLSAKRQAMITKAFASSGEDKTAKAPTKAEVNKTVSPSVPEAKPHIENMNEAAIQSWIQKYVSNNKLVRLSIERNRERITLPCRILNYASDTRTINVYHVDEKQVYTFRLSEIIDFVDA